MSNRKQHTICSNTHQETNQMPAELIADFGHGHGHGQ